jgi:hypothetical protein
MTCPFCCFLQDYIGQFVNIGFVVNCCLDNATPPINHVYGAGFLKKSSFYGDSIRLYDSPTKNANVIFTGRCDDIFELHFPQLGTNNTLSIDELKAKAEERVSYSYVSLDGNSKEEE